MRQMPVGPIQGTDFDTIFDTKVGPWDFIDLMVGKDLFSHPLITHEQSRIPVA